MRRFLPVFAAFFLALPLPAPAQNASDKMPGLNTDMGDMALDAGTALPPPGFEDGKVTRMQPGQSATLPPSQAYPDVSPAAEPTAPEGALPPTATPEAAAPAAPIPADPAQAKTPLIP